ALEKANGGWFPVCLVGELLAYAGYIVAYRDTARVDGGPCFDLWTSTRIIAIGFGAFVAGSSAGTLGLDYWALHRAGEKPHLAARRVLALNTIEWAVLATFAWIAGAILLAGFGSGAPLPMEVAWLAVVPFCVGAALWVSSPARVERLSSLPREDADLTRDPRTWPRWLRVVVKAGFSDAVGGVVIVRHLVSRPRRHLGAVLGFPLYWLGDITTLWAALRAFGVHPNIPALVLAYTTAYVVTALPLPAGGAGGIEAGVAFSLHAVGIALAPALLATLVYRVFTLWLPIGPALAALSQVRTLSDELPDVPHAEPT
ncbi:MAG: lysylphosphatidylglycerol synthase domain-containing protein, partial [Gaiellaceae bacterium]